MQDVLSYFFWPNPGNVTYGSPKALALLVLCGACIAVSILLRLWRRRLGNPVLRKLSTSWPAIVLWFGISGVVLVVARVEGIQFLAMRVLWFVWAVAFLLTLLFQLWKFRMRYYEVVPQERMLDPLEEYLPKRRRR